MEKCFQEAVRYLGYGKNPVDEATSRLVEKGFLELEKVSALRSVFRIFEMNRIDEEKVAIGTLQISSKSLARNLNHCEKAVLFGATLGTGVDRLIARTSLTDMANAVVLQACAAAMLEEFCDEKQFEIGEELEKEGLYLRPRFSPGYGDFDIGFQKSFMPDAGLCKGNRTYDDGKFYDDTDEICYRSDRGKSNKREMPDCRLRSLR